MATVARVTLAGYDALTETDKTKYSLRSDEDNVLIKEKDRGNGTVPAGNTATIAHNLGYIPFYMVYTEVSSGRYRIQNAFNPVASGWKTYTDNNNLYIENDFFSTTTGYKYFIFYDNMD
jgi:hypothetical protein